MERWERLPYGVGQFSWRWYLFVVGLMAVVGWAAYAYSVQLREGLVVTGLRDWGTMGGATWGLYIAFLVYFVGVSFAGIVVAALIRLLRLEFLRPLSRAAELMAIISLLMGSLSILPDVGQPLRALINLPLYARPQSPFYGDFTLIVAGYLFASLVYFYLAGRRDAAILAQKKTPLQWFYRLWAAGWRDTPQERARHERVSFFLALAILPLLVTALLDSRIYLWVDGRPTRLVQRLASAGICGHGRGLRGRDAHPDRSILEKSPGGDGAPGRARLPVAQHFSYGPGARLSLFYGGGAADEHIYGALS
jgi:Ni/Fe-hydrogenase subunit HybB-like protein